VVHRVCSRPIDRANEPLLPAGSSGSDKRRSDSYVLGFLACFFAAFFDVFSAAAGVLVGGVVSIRLTSAGFTGAALPGPS
jgi:hypothetical protein